jgi:hypothetical protein
VPVILPVASISIGPLHARPTFALSGTVVFEKTRRLPNAWNLSARSGVAETCCTPTKSPM